MSLWVVGLLVAVGAPDSELAGLAELKAEVPALNAFHEVIYPLWHTAWPERDFKLMKELLPDVQKHVAAVVKAELPGILRDKKAEWNESVGALTATLATYEKAAAANDEKNLLGAVEEIHSRYEALVRIIRPPMKELDAYHVVLYQIYHHFGPEKQLEPLRGAAAELGGKCEALAKAEAPRWFKGDREKLAAEIGALCARTGELREAAKGEAWDPVAAAVEAVHTQYQKVAAVFE